MNQIRNALHISDAATTRTLTDDHDFDEIVTLGYRNRIDSALPAESTTGDEFVFPDGPHEFAVFESAVNYVVDALNRDDRVLVHCQAGISRSCGVCAVALTECEELSVSDALRDIQHARPRVNPGPAVRESMEQYTGDEIDQPTVDSNMP